MHRHRHAGVPSIGGLNFGANAAAAGLTSPTSAGYAGPVGFTNAPAGSPAGAVLRSPGKCPMIATGRLQIDLVNLISANASFSRKFPGSRTISARLLRHQWLEPTARFPCSHLITRPRATTCLRLLASRGRCCLDGAGTVGPDPRAATCLSANTYTFHTDIVMNSLTRYRLMSGFAPRLWAGTWLPRARSPGRSSARTVAVALPDLAEGLLPCGGASPSAVDRRRGCHRAGARRQRGGPVGDAGILVSRA